MLEATGYLFARWDSVGRKAWVRLCYDRCVSIAPGYVDIGSFIDQREGYRGGRPFIVGTGITVDAISCRWGIDEWSPETIAEEYNITLPQVMAALTFYFANKATIDREIEEQDREFERAAAEYEAKYGSVMDRIRARRGE